MNDTQVKPRPLDGITVVSLEHAIAAPFCTRQLADLGARVIKVERPGGGDICPTLYLTDTDVDGDSTLFHAINRNKESLAIDLKDPDDLAALRRLIARADVPTATAISEYVDVAHAFFDPREAKFVNGVLDSVAKAVR